MDNGVCQRNFCPEKLGPGPWTWNFSPVGYAMQDTLTIFLSYTVGSTSSHLPIHYINHIPIIEYDSTLYVGMARKKNGGQYKHMAIARTRTQVL